MKHLFVGLGLSILLLTHLTAGAEKVKTSDESAVRATVTNYIEAYYAGDADRMQQTLHAHYLKHVIHGNIPMRDDRAGDDSGSAR